ncbi:coiled-coil domain-containing protein 144A isoform X3 [Callithrix jacchus]
MRRTFRGGRPEDQWPSGSLTSWRPDSSLSRRKREAEIFAPPRYRVDPEDLEELHRAAWRGDVPGLERVLVPGGPGVDERDNENRTALHFACACGHPAVVALLVDRKCQLNCFDSNKRTALIKAVQCKKEECATILLERGADPDLPDIYGNTALHYAVHNEDESLAEKLLLYSTNMEANNEKQGLTELLRLVSDSWVHVILLPWPPRVLDLQDDLTPLLFAISLKRQQMVELLLERGANLLAVDKCQRTALILAVQCGSANIVSLLLQQKIDIFSQDMFGRTAEDYAIFNRFTGIQQLIAEYKEKQTPESLPQNNNQEEQDLELPSEEEEGRLKGCENKQPQVEEEMKQHTSNNVELSGSLPGGAAAGSDDDGLNQQFPRKENEVHDRAENKTSTEKSQVKNQIHPGADFADSVRPSETDSECKLSDSTYENFLLWIEQLRMKCKESVSLSRIEDAFHLYENFLELKNSEHERLIAEIKQMGNMVSVLQKELSETKETKLQLEHQKIEWERKLRRLRLALKQEKEKKENAEMLCNKVSEQLRIKEEESTEKAEMTQGLKRSLRKLIKELRMVKQQQKDAQQQLSEEQNARIVQDQILTSKPKELEMAQKKMDSEDKMKADMSDLQARNEILSETLANAENEINILQIQLHNARDAVGEQNLILERVLRDLGQTQCQKKEIEQMHQTQQRKLKKYIAKQGSVEERLFQLQNENTLLQQQLDDAHKKVNNQEKTISSLHDQIQALASNTRSEHEKQSLLLQEKNEELLDECNYFEKRMDQCEKEKAGRKVVMRQHQLEWTDPLKQQPTAETTSFNLDETQDSKKKLGQSSSEDDLTEPQETAPSQCPDLDAENEVLQQILFSTKALEKKCQTLEEEMQQLKQTQAASEEQLVQRVNDIPAEKTRLELTIKDLQSEHSRVKTSEAENKIELEMYEKLYQEKLQVVKSLSNELRRTMEMTAEVSPQLTVEKEKTRYPATASTARPVLVSPSVGNLSECLNRRHIEGKSRSSHESMESFMSRMQQKLEKDIR